MGREDDYTIEPGANLMDANLEDANLMGADLTDANLSDANLSRAKPEDANPEDADSNPEDGSLARANPISPKLSYEKAGSSSACVAQAQTYLFDTLADLDSDFRESLTAPQIATDAAAVDGCIQAFAKAELSGVAVGRAGPAKFFPAIGDYGSKALSKLDDEQQGHLRDLIGVTIGIGYTFVASAGARPGELPGHSDREVWPIWLGSISGDLMQQYGFPQDVISFWRSIGASAFSEWANSTSGGRTRGRRKVERSGGYYTQAGMALRACQEFQGSFPEDPLADLWPYERFAT